jgi:hypothetical protein
LRRKCRLAFESPQKKRLAISPPDLAKYYDSARHGPRRIDGRRDRYPYSGVPDPQAAAIHAAPLESR